MNLLSVVWRWLVKIPTSVTLCCDMDVWEWISSSLTHRLVTEVTAL